jgi:hypothetical protein
MPEKRVLGNKTARRDWGNAGSFSRFQDMTGARLKHKFGRRKGFSAFVLGKVGVTPR